MSGQIRSISWVCLFLFALPLVATPALAQRSKADDGAKTQSDQGNQESDSPSDGQVELDDSAMATGKQADPKTRQYMLVASLTIFVLAIFVGFEVITKVPPTLHTPLMSGSNAISGITIVGALLIAGLGLGFDSFLGFIAVILAAINVVGGFLVTHRMLAMFKKR
jgi:NAD(P) transhydrogenase subunit alpha